MIGLPCGEEIMTICQAVLMQYRNVTDRQNSYINIARQYVDARRDKNVREPEVNLNLVSIVPAAGDFTLAGSPS